MDLCCFESVQGLPYYAFTSWQAANEAEVWSENMIIKWYWLLNWMSILIKSYCKKKKTQNKTDDDVMKRWSVWWNRCLLQVSCAQVSCAKDTPSRAVDISLLTDWSGLCERSHALGEVNVTKRTSNYDTFTLCFFFLFSVECKLLKFMS